MINVDSIVSDIAEWQESHKFIKPLDRKKTLKNNRELEKQYKELFVKSLINNIDKWEHADTWTYECEYGDVVFTVQNLLDISCYVYIDSHRVADFNNVSWFEGIGIAARKMIRFVGKRNNTRSLNKSNELLEKGLSDCMRQVD